MKNWVDIDIHLRDGYDFFCPACGAHIEVEATENCEHVMAMNIDAVGMELQAVNPRYSELVKELEKLEEDLEIDSIVEAFAEKTASPSVMFLSVTGSAVTGHGPYSERVIVGINYAPDKE